MLPNVFTKCACSPLLALNPEKRKIVFLMTAETGSSSVAMTHHGIAYLISRSMSEGMDSGNPHHRSSATVTMTCSHVPPITHTPFLCHNMAFRWGVCNRLANKTLLNGWTELIINRREKISHIYDAGKVFETPSASMQIFKLIMYSSERDRQYLSKSHCIMYKLLYFNYSCVYIVLCLSVVFCSMFTLRATWMHSEAKHTLKNYVSIIYITNLDNDGCYISKLHALRKTDVK